MIASHSGKAEDRRLKFIHRATGAVFRGGPSRVRDQMRYAMGVADPTPPVPDAPTDITAVQDAPLDAPDAIEPGIIPVDRIPLLQGFTPPAETVTKTGTPLTGDEDVKSKVRVRTRYPVDAFDTGEIVVTAEGVKVDGAKLSGLVAKARESGIELERI